MTSALQAIVFDFDGVIADSEPLHLRAYQQALAEEGIALSREEYFERYLGYDDVGMLEALASDRGLAMTGGHITALVARKGEKLQAMLNGGEVLFPGAAAFVRTAAAAVPIAIASGALRHEIVQIIDGAGLGGSLHDDRGLRRHAGEQAVAGAVPARVRAAAAGGRPATSTRGGAWPSRIPCGGSNRRAEPGYAVWG